MSNPTIGMVTCPLSGEPAAVRRDKRRNFYYISIAGKIAPSSDFGQQWFADNATIWGEGMPPDDAPDWIAEGKSFPENTTSRRRGNERVSNSTSESTVERQQPEPDSIPAPVQPEPVTTPESDPETLPDTETEKPRSVMDWLGGS